MVFLAFFIYTLFPEESTGTEGPNAVWGRDSSHGQ